MIWTMYQTVLWLHIVIAILWVGGVMFVGWAVYPASNKLDRAQQRTFLTALMKHTHWLFVIEGIGVISQVFYSVPSSGQLTNGVIYIQQCMGSKFIAAFFLAVFVLLWGSLIGFRKTMNVLEDNTIWNLAKKDMCTPLNRAFRFTALVAGVEVIGFLGIIALMLQI